MKFVEKKNENNEVKKKIVTVSAARLCRPFVYTVYLENCDSK